MANLRTHYTMIILVFGLLPLGTGAPGDQSTAKSASLLPEIFVAHNLTESKEANSEERFVGTWEGKCQDERPFVIVALKQDGKQLAGTRSKIRSIVVPRMSLGGIAQQSAGPR